MSILDKLKRGGESLPPRIVLAGPEGIGKTTFGASAPKPVFIAQERGMKGWEHIPHLIPADFNEVLEIIDALIAAPTKDYDYLVIDTVDWLERCIHQTMCARDKQANIEAYGYGKGYKIAEGELIKLLSKLDALQQSKKMGIILLSHVHIRTFNDPEGVSYDRFEMKGNKNFTGILREWPDACLFVRNEVFKTKEGNKEKAVDGGKIIHTVWAPGWDAKNRLGLPETLTMPVDDPFGPFSRSVEENSPATFRKKLNELLKTAPIPANAQAAWKKVDPEKLGSEELKRAIGKLQEYK